MTDTATAYDASHRPWPFRAGMMTLAGAGIGIALHFLLRGARPYALTEDSGRLALAAFLTIGGIAFGFVVERRRPLLAAGFALAAGAVVAGVVYWNGDPSDWHGSEDSRVSCALLTVAIAAPLFQAWRGAGARGDIPYAAAHNHAWTDVVLWFAAWVFVGLALGLAHLLAGLFDLIGLKFLHQLLDKPWFVELLVGAAFGGAVGRLRDRERLLGTLQRVVTAVLAALAPVLAVGLAVFLCALPFTGIAPLWGATKSTTPILLSCVIAALILANDVIGDAPEVALRPRVLRWSATALGATMLPLAVLAAVSTGFRIAQYGMTPDRLWAVVFTGVATAYGLAYLVTLVRYRGGWTTPVRRANLRLALGLCGLAFVLSTPLFSFGAIATRDQLARLDSGRTRPDHFDWSALRYDFGPAGRAAVRQRARADRDPAIRAAAAAALKSTNWWDARQQVARVGGEHDLDSRLVIVPVRVLLPADLRQRLVEDDACGLEGACALLYAPGASEAFVAHVPAPCAPRRCVGQVDGDGDAVDFPVGITRTARLTRTVTGWRDPDPAVSPAITPAERKAQVAAATAVRARQLDAVRRGAVDVRDVRRRQLFIAGVPVGEVFDEAAPVNRP